MLLSKNSEQCNNLANCQIRNVSNFCFLLCHFKVYGLGKFATFGQFFILASAHSGVAENILANFAIPVACLELPFFVYP